MLTAIRNWVLRTMMKSKGETGIVRTLPNKDIVELNTQITAQRLMQNGVDPQSLKNADQVENVIKNIEAAEKANLAKNIRGGFMATDGSRFAKVFDMEGKEIPKGSKIMGGKEIKETDAQIKARLDKRNKEGIARIRERQKMLDDAIDNMSPSLSGDTRTDAVLVAEDLAERMGLVYDDLPIREQTKLYDQAYQGLSKMRFEARQTPKGAPPKITSKKDADSQESSYDDGPADFDPDADNETFATGGRAGFANGGIESMIAKGATADDVKRMQDAELMNKLNQYFNIEGEFKKPGKKQLKGAPEGVTIDREAYNFLIDARIPVSEKIDFLTRFGREKVRNRLERDDQELFLGEGGSRQRAIGAGINLDAKKGLSGSIMYEPDTGRKNFGISYKFNKGGRAGFFLGSANPRGLGLLREILKYSSKKGKELDKFKGVDLSALDMLRLSNPKRFNKMLEDVQGKVNIREGIMATDTIRAQQQALRKQRKGLTEGALQVAKDMKARDDAMAKRIAEENKKTTIPKVKKELMESMGMSEEKAQKMAESMAEAISKMRPLDASPEITEEGILQLENVLKNMETGGKPLRDLNADGGRIGFKDGMTRRTFLKIFGGLVSLPIIGKIVKPLKLTTGVKKVPIIKTDNVPGKPEWFDTLVNKVIVEGDDVTKKFATAERQSIHQKTLDDGSVVRVTEDVDDGAIRVEYDSKTNPYEETTQLEYKKPLPDEGAPDPKAEFSAAESGPFARSDSARLDFEKEIEEFATGNVDELVTDFSKLKEYATGKKPTMKEIVEAKKKKDQAKKLTEGDFDAEYELMEERQGLPFYDPPMPDDFASGGIARMLGE